MPAQLIPRLRNALVNLLSEGSWAVIRETHRVVGLGWREEYEPGFGKPKYLRRVLNDLSDEQLVELARRTHQKLVDRDRIALADALDWLDARGVAKVTEVTRIRLAERLRGLVLVPRETPNETLRRFARSVGDERTFEYDEQHSLVEVRTQFSGQLLAIQTWKSRETRIEATMRDVLDAYGFNSWPDRRVFEFLETLVHPRTRLGDEQAKLVHTLNGVLASDRLELVPTEEQSGQPVFTVSGRREGVAGKPKNLIFASVGHHPEIGFADAVNNDIVILRHAELCLVYEEPIGAEGLRWTDLVRWWAKRSGLGVEEMPIARKQLGTRLKDSLKNSPAEENFFAAYFQTMHEKLGDELPALVPQVYLHYDPLRLRELHARSEGKRFDVQRMDFLLLLPNSVRVVVEIDGQQHYSTGIDRDAKPSPKAYSATVRSDRDLRLAGYEVYRFAGLEMRDKASAEAVTREFFVRLFRRHKLITS